MNQGGPALAGVLLMIGGAWSVISIVLAESLSPGYSVVNETISGLGSSIFSGICTDIPRCVTFTQPASAIFVLSLFVTGLLTAWGGFVLRHLLIRMSLALVIIAIGIAQAVIGISYIPLYIGDASASLVQVSYFVHSIAALLFFVLTPLAAVYIYRFAWGPFRFFSLALGVFALAAAFLFLSGNYLALGRGGMERMIVFPLDLWLVALGAYVGSGSSLNKSLIMPSEAQ